MTIQAKHTGEVENISSFKVEFVVVCDHCGGEICEEFPGNVEIPKGEEGDLKEIFFLHKNCSREFKERNGYTLERGLLWLDLCGVTIETK